MTQTELCQAFEFYYVSNEEYKEQLEKALSEINGSSSLSLAFERGKNAIYTHNTQILNNVYNLFRKREDFFGQNMPNLATDLLILSGFEYHKSNMERYNFDKNQINIHRSTIGSILLYYIDSKIEVPPISVICGSWFINGKLLYVGRLQYEFCNMDGKMPTNIVKIHIAPGEKLSRNLVDSSLKEATALIKKTYGVTSLEIRCATWLLSNQLKDCVEPNTNIAYFRSLFSVTDMSSCVDEVMGYLFHVESETPYIKLPEDTSLQKKVKAHLLAGGDITKGNGLLIKEY